MTINLDYYLKYTRTNETMSQSDIQELSDNYSEQYNNSISHFDIIIGSDRADTIYKNDIVYKCIVDYGKKKNQNTDLSIREIHTRHSDGFKVGDIIQLEHKVSKELSTFLFTKSIETIDGYDLSSIQECNNTIKFKLQDNTIHTIPCIISDKSSVYADGEQTSKYLTLRDDQISVTVQNNELTSQLQEQQRFIFNNDEKCIYKLTKIQSLINTGLLTLTMNVDTKQSDDRVDLNLANYKIIIPQPEPTPTGYSIVIEGDDSITIGGNTSTYTAKVYSDNVLVEGMSVVWSLDNTEFATIQSSTGNTCIVKSYDGYSYGEVVLSAILVDDNSVVGEKNIEIVSLF